MCVCVYISDYSASLGSEEESGKDWDELEEEARKGESTLHSPQGGKNLAYIPEARGTIACWSMV